MTRLDIISIIEDNTLVNVWKDGEIIAIYDGKNSIPNELNDKQVFNISFEKTTDQCRGNYFVNMELRG